MFHNVSSSGPVCVRERAISGKGGMIRTGIEPCKHIDIKLNLKRCTNKVFLWNYGIF